MRIIGLSDNQFMIITALSRNTNRHEKELLNTICIEFRGVDMSVINRVLGFLSDKPYIFFQYYKHTHRLLNLNNPTRFNEKLQWLKLYDHKPIYTMLVDKYLAKGYVSEAIGERYVVPLLGVWDSADDIDFDQLPDKFVLKTNHDSKGVIICKNKAQMNFAEACTFLNARLCHNGFNYGREWPYKNVKRKIIAEQFLEDENGELPDYKVMCFNGEPKLIQLHRGRFTADYTQDIYDVNWVRQAFNQVGLQGSAKTIPRPSFLEEMIEKSAVLSKNIPQVRVDWFYANRQLFFGEMTFFDASGYDDFVPDEVNELIGSWISLPPKTI